MAKYSFEATTVGEMLDTPEIMELINKYIPAVLEHPLLEVGRSFIFNDALPYIEDMVTEDDLAAYKEALEALSDTAQPKHRAGGAGPPTALAFTRGRRDRPRFAITSRPR